jgi:Ni,Fe-hydrogenase maturation factor
MLAGRFGRQIVEDPDLGYDFSGQEPEILSALQLTPEMAEWLSNFERVCFIDAHTGDLQEDFRSSPINPQFQSSPFTHHLSPESLLALTESLYHAAPKAILVSLRGYEFGFSRQLSPQTAALADQAVNHILEWVDA